MALPPTTSTTDVYLAAVLERLDTLIALVTPAPAPEPAPEPPLRKRAPRKPAEK